jgi:hypothetical protein
MDLTIVWFLIVPQLKMCEPVGTVKHIKRDLETQGFGDCIVHIPSDDKGAMDLICKTPKGSARLQFYQPMSRCRLELEPKNKYTTREKL